MRFSNLFIPTTKETPNDATLPSHQFLIRGGFINMQGAGLYNFMPLGKIVLEKIRAIVKDELDKAGCNEVQLGFVTPMELWEESGRANKMGKEMLRFKDRKDAEFVLSPTNEEAMVTLVKNRVTSYKDLPLNLYQINTKFRDEARPRFGLMRGREFLMKDGYSFHDSVDDMVREFNHMEETYKKIFTRLGLDFRVVEADSGAIGGTGSKEFHVLANSGEDTIVVCDSCEYGANIEAAKREPKLVSDKLEKPYGKIETPNLTSIEEVSEFLGVKASQTIKAVIKKAIYEEGSEVIVYFVRGDDELEETKAANAVNCLDLIDADENDIANAGLVAGYVGVENLPEGIKCFVDIELKDETSMVTGANEKNYHLQNVNLSSLELTYADLVAVAQGDTCACCGGKLSYTKGIEAGHIFQLGTVYSEPLGANFLDQNGKSQPFVMGTYGIGVSRLLAAIIEQNHDEKGCIWTKESAPFAVDIIVSNGKKQEEQDAASKIYEDLKSKGIDTIVDDRVKERFGFKMKDFELIGFPYAIIVGKNIADGLVEIVDRKNTSEKVLVKLEEVVSKIEELIA